MTHYYKTMEWSNLTEAKERPENRNEISHDVNLTIFMRFKKKKNKV